MKREHAKLVEKVMTFEAKNKQLVIVTNNTTLQVHEKIYLIDQLWADMDEGEAMIRVWKFWMDQLASGKKDAKAELVSFENQL